jgi:hypothetical protein
MEKTIYFSGEDTWFATESFVNELKEFLHNYKFYDYAKKYLSKSDYQKLKNFDYEDSPSLSWGELWEPPFFELFDIGIFVRDDNGSRCDNPKQLMEYLIDHFLSEVNEHSDFIKGKTLISSQDEDNSCRSIIEYLMDKGLKDALKKVFKSEEDIEMFAGDCEYEADDIPGGHTINSMGHSAMYESYYYDIYFEDSKTREAIKYIFEIAKEEKR